MDEKYLVNFNWGLTSPFFYVGKILKFIDEVNIHICSGSGGHGCISFRREKFVPRGGPDGGHGGRGGHVYFQADENINTLMHFRGKKDYMAQDGENGRGSGQNGLSGEDLILKVPVGTVLYNSETNDPIIDLNAHEQKVLIAQGGRGGLGNSYFKSSTNQAPQYAQEGDLGQDLFIRLELKLLADIALIGLPNAGKSTLISTISAAKPKIADYPFTTLEPNLGVVSLGEKSVVVADIPGLIENAATGKGLGIKFLKHIERTNALVHLIDCSMFIELYEAMEAYSTVRAEVLKYSQKLANKKEIVCITKIDSMSEEEIQSYVDYLSKELDKKVLPLSSVSHRNIELLTKIMIESKDALSEEKL